MKTIKSHTDLEQSRKLAEILPLETADMHYNNVSIKGINYVDGHRAELMEYNRAIEALSKYTVNPLFEVIPCWSLAALLAVLSFPVLRYDIEDGEGGWIVGCEKNDKGYLSHYRDNPVDTCYEMILRLHEQNLI